MTRRAVLALLAGLACAVPSQAQDRPAVTVHAERAWIRLPPAGRTVTAGFLDIVNEGASPIRVVGARSSAAGTIELHEMAQDNGMMRMRQIRGIDVPAQGRVALAPGGLHLMLFDLPAPLSVGTPVRLTLLLADGATVDVVAEVRTPTPSR
jgi:copper(I)-binding protein